MGDVFYMVITEGNEHESEPIPYVTDSWFDAMNEVDDSLTKYTYTRSCLVIEFVDGRGVNGVRYFKDDKHAHIVF